jgi:hypothetical protein
MIDFLCMPQTECFRESRMREIRTSGLKRGEATLFARHTTIEARTGNPDTELGRSLNTQRSSSTLLARFYPSGAKPRGSLFSFRFPGQYAKH